MSRINHRLAPHLPVSHLSAIGFSLAGFSIWVFGDTMVKLVGSLSIPKYEIAFVGALTGMLTIAIMPFLRGELYKLHPKRPDILAILGALYASNFFLQIWVMPKLPMADFYVFTFLTPIVIAILAAVFLHEHLTWKHGLAILAGFSGVIIAVDPASILNGTTNNLVYVAAFGFMLTNAFIMLVVRILGHHETRECIAFYPRIAAVVAGLAMGMVYGFAAMPLNGIIIATASGILGGLGWLCMAQAYKLAPAGTIAPFHYSQLLIGAVIGYFVWNDVPTLHVLVGAVVIVASGLYIAMHARKAGIMAKVLAETSQT